jgi:hypothetical protein
LRRGEFNAGIVQFYLTSVELALRTREVAVTVIRSAFTVVDIGPRCVNRVLPIADVFFASGYRC